MVTHQHTVRFFRNTASGQCQAICTCGWKAAGDRDEIQARAATHDMDAIENEAEAAYDRQQQRLMENGPGPTLQEQQIAAMRFK